MATILLVARDSFYADVVETLLLEAGITLHRVASLQEIESEANKASEGVLKLAIFFERGLLLEALCGASSQLDSCAILLVDSCHLVERYASLMEVRPVSYISTPINLSRLQNRIFQLLNIS